MIKCIDYIPINVNTCLGRATISVEEWGVELSGFILHEKEKKRWVSFPSRMYVDEETGKKTYIPYLKIPDKSRYFKFCDDVKEAIDEYIKNSSNQAESEEVPF